MVETVKTQSALLAQMADGGNNTAEEVRDNIVSGWTSGWVRYLDHRLPAETAHDDDDFFNDDDNTAWTAITPSGTATWTELHGLQSVEVTSQTIGDTAALVIALTPNTSPVYVETAARIFPFSLSAADDQIRIGVGFTDGTTGAANVVHALYTIQNVAVDPTSGSPFCALYHGTVTDAFNTVAGFFNVSYQPGFGFPIYMRCIWVAANTFEAQFSIDGVTWFQAGIGQAAKTMTPTHVALTVASDGTDTVAEYAYAAFDYLRVGETNPL